jgi:hypothetical protein
MLPSSSKSSMSSFKKVVTSFQSSIKPAIFFSISLVSFVALYRYFSSPRVFD